MLIGISFPFRKENGEFPKTDKEIAAVQSNIRALFNLPIRSRVMRPQIGTNVYQFAFENITDFMLTKLYRAIKTTIDLGEPRASVQDIQFTVDKTLVIADISYSVNGVLDELTLEIPKSSA